ncbi:MerR family transcriptional regulator [Rhodococcus sp. NPDC127528]|uniref:DNA polymerase III subunit beta family protein n=1 Tax=unclassified Rhodococcus (in: high G+C Gram-positive bacteria) TaxID=192944 RepID=UPI003633BDD6
MTDDATDEWITIGVLARASGLTPSALRFYDDCRLLVPARVDASSGYRYYSGQQRAQAVMIRRLREIGMPIDAVAMVLAGDPDRAARLLDEHVLDLERRARDGAAVADAVKRALGTDPATGRPTLAGTHLADAVGQVLPAAARDRTIPVLRGILVEATPGSLTLTATDRYLLSTRSLVLPQQAGESWSAVVAADELATAASGLRGEGEIGLTATAARLTLHAGGNRFDCTVIDEPYPDYRGMLAALAPTRTRVVVPRLALLDALDAVRDTPIRCTVGGGELTIGGGDGQDRLSVPATVTGPEVTLAFDPVTLRPALLSAVGPDLMLDLSRPDQPVVIRSATDGDLTTLAMPTAT